MTATTSIPRHKIRNPKNIQEGTANHVRMILNEIAAGNASEAGYLADDLLDEIVSGALVVTMRVPPMDHIAVDKLQQEAYARGVAEGRRQGFIDARKALAARVAEALNT